MNCGKKKKGGIYQSKSTKHLLFLQNCPERGYPVAYFMPCGMGPAVTSTFKRPLISSPPSSLLIMNLVSSLYLRGLGSSNLRADKTGDWGVREKQQEEWISSQASWAEREGVGESGRRLIKRCQQAFSWESKCVSMQSFLGGIAEARSVWKEWNCKADNIAECQAKEK